MKKFEYKMESAYLYPDMLNKLGEDGWELVTILQKTDGQIWVFKREIKQDDLKLFGY